MKYVLPSQNIRPTTIEMKVGTDDVNRLEIYISDDVPILETNGEALDPHAKNVLMSNYGINVSYNFIDFVPLEIFPDLSSVKNKFDNFCLVVDTTDNLRLLPWVEKEKRNSFVDSYQLFHFKLFNCHSKYPVNYFYHDYQTGSYIRFAGFLSKIPKEILMMPEMFYFLSPNFGYFELPSKFKVFCWSKDQMIYHRKNDRNVQPWPTEWPGILKEDLIGTTASNIMTVFSKMEVPCEIINFYESDGKNWIYFLGQNKERTKLIFAGNLPGTIPSMTETSEFFSNLIRNFI